MKIQAKTQENTGEGVLQMVGRSSLEPPVLYQGLLVVWLPALAIACCHQGGISRGDLRLIIRHR